MKILGVGRRITTQLWHGLLGILCSILPKSLLTVLPYIPCPAASCQLWHRADLRLSHFCAASLQGELQTVLVCGSTTASMSWALTGGKGRAKKEARAGMQHLLRLSVAPTAANTGPRCCSTACRKPLTRGVVFRKIRKAPAEGPLHFFIPRL